MLCSVLSKDETVSESYLMFCCTSSEVERIEFMGGDGKHYVMFFTYCNYSVQNNGSEFSKFSNFTEDPPDMSQGDGNCVDRWR